jgi:hypothetical protein
VLYSHWRLLIDLSDSQFRERKVGDSKIIFRWGAWGRLRTIREKEAIGSRLVVVSCDTHGEF